MAESARGKIPATDPRAPQIVRDLERFKAARALGAHAEDDPSPPDVEFRMLTSCMTHCRPRSPHTDLTDDERASLTRHEPMVPHSPSKPVSDQGYPGARRLPRQESVPSLADEITHGAAHADGAWW